MTDEEIREACLGWIKDETNNDFINSETEEEELPGGVIIALDLMVKNYDVPLNVQSKKHRKMSITYFPAKIAQKIYDLISPYRKLKW